MLGQLFSIQTNAKDIEVSFLMIVCSIVRRQKNCLLSLQWLTFETVYGQVMTAEACMSRCLATIVE